MTSFSQRWTKRRVLHYEIDLATLKIMIIGPYLDMINIIRQYYKDYGIYVACGKNCDNYYVGQTMTSF